MEERFQDEETDMRCVICKQGDTASGTVTVTLQRGNTVIIVRDVPAAVCQNCGEYYLDEAVAKKLYQQGEEAVRRHAEVEILRYAA
jgi:YgiT-type zinc finger domain-containing protein